MTMPSSNKCIFRLLEILLEIHFLGWLLGLGIWVKEVA